MERQLHLGQFLGNLKKLADVFNISVVITNHTHEWRENFKCTTKVYGGYIMGHACTTRLSLEVDHNGNRLCKLIHSPCLREDEARFVICD